LAMSERARVVGIQYGWSQFLWKWLDTIQMLRFQGRTDIALETLFQLCDLLPRKVYDAIADEVARAKREYYAPFETPTDPFQTIRLASKVQQRRAGKLIGRLLRMLQDELEKRGYLERRKEEPEVGRLP